MKLRPLGSPPEPEPNQPNQPASVTFNCPLCGVLLEALAGQLVACAQCATPMTAPTVAGGPAKLSLPTAPVAAPTKKSPLPWVIVSAAIVLFVVAGVVWWMRSRPVTSKSVITKTARPTRPAPAPATPVVPVPPVAVTGSWKLEDPATVNAWQFGGTGKEAINDMVARPDGRLVIAGTLGSLDGLPPAGKRHNLLDNQSGALFGFVAELSVDGQTLNWFSIFGGDLFQPKRLALGPDGSVYLGGKHLPRLASVAGQAAGSFADKEAALIKLSADGAAVEWVRAGGPNQLAIEGLAVDPQGRVVWTAPARGRGMAAYVLRRNADGSDSKFPARGTRDWAIDLHLSTDDFMRAGQVGAFYALSKQGEGHDYDGPGPYGPVRYNIHGFRGGGHVVILPDGDIVASGALLYDFKLDNRWNPAYDIILARFSPDGALKWSSNLYQPNDSVHIPDQKDRDLLYNPANGDLYILAVQHGSNVYRLKGNLVGDTGNMMIGWIGQIDAATGQVKNGWYWMNSRNTAYDATGTPQSPPHPKLAGNAPQRLATDSQSRIYMAGNAGAKAWSSPHAWKTWPADQDGGGNAALIILSPNLDRVLYSTIIRGTEGSKTSADTLAVTSAGIWVGGDNAGADFPTGRFPAWNKSAPTDADAALTHFRFEPAN